MDEFRVGDNVVLINCVSHPCNGLSGVIVSDAHSGLWVVDFPRQRGVLVHSTNLKADAVKEVVPNDIVSKTCCFACLHPFLEENVKAVNNKAPERIICRTCGAVHCVEDMELIFMDRFAVDVCSSS